MNKKAFALIFCSFLLIPAVCRAEATEVIAIVGAMREETEPILVRMSVTTSYTHENAMIWKGSLNGKDVILAQCGIGQKNAEKCTSFLLNNYTVGALIFCGGGGSTKLDIGTDEVVISSEIMSLNPFETYETDDGLASIALNNSFDFDVHYGRFYTATPLMLDELILYPYLWIRGVKCVEMENLPMAEIAAERGVPFLSVRGVSDQIPLLPFMFLQYRRHADVAAEHAAAVVAGLVADM